MRVLLHEIDSVINTMYEENPGLESLFLNDKKDHLSAKRLEMMGVWKYLKINLIIYGREFFNRIIFSTQPLNHDYVTVNLYSFNLDQLQDNSTTSSLTYHRLIEADPDIYEPRNDDSVYDVFHIRKKSLPTFFPIQLYESVYNHHNLSESKI